MKQREILKEAELLQLAEQGGSNRRETSTGFCAALGSLADLIVWGDYPFRRAAESQQKENHS